MQLDRTPAINWDCSDKPGCSVSAMKTYPKCRMGVDIGFQSGKREFFFGDVSCRGSINRLLKKEHWYTYLWEEMAGHVFLLGILI